MSIRTIMDKIVAIQGKLSITDPGVVEVKKVWKYVPPQNMTITDIPCWMNTWTVGKCIWGAGNQREVPYRVNMKLLAADATQQQDKAADIATAFWGEALKAFQDDHMLGGDDRIQDLEGGEPTLIIIDYGTRSYVGLNLFLNILVSEGNT